MKGIKMTTKNELTELQKIKLENAQLKFAIRTLKLRIDDIKLICIYDKDSDIWMVFPKNITGLIVQVDKLEDAPRELAKSFEVMLKYGFDKDVHEKHGLSLNGG